MKYLDLKSINQPYEHAADEVLRSGWYLRGECTRMFERHYAEYIGTKHCIGCANGLDALTWSSFQPTRISPPFSPSRRTFSNLCSLSQTLIRSK